MNLPHKNLDLSVVIASYKKEFVILETLEALIEILNYNKIEFEIIVVIDGNIDRTFERIKENFNSQVRVFSLDKNQGKGFALRFGVDKIENKNQVVAFLDADLDISPVALIFGLDYLLRNSEIDCVVGSKFHKQSKINYSWQRVITSRLYSFFVKNLFRIDLSETQTGLKLFRYECIKLAIKNTTANRFSFDLELMLKIHENQYKIYEIPVNLNHDGRSTINFYSIIQTFFGTLKVFFRFIKLKGRC